MSDRRRKQIFSLVTAAFVLSFLWASFRCLTLCEVYKAKLAGSPHECCVEPNGVPAIASAQTCPCGSLHGSLDRESSGLTQGVQKFDHRPALYHFETAWFSSTETSAVSFGFSLEHSALSNRAGGQRVSSVDAFLLNGILLI